MAGNNGTSGKGHRGSDRLAWRRAIPWDRLRLREKASMLVFSVALVLGMLVTLVVVLEYLDRGGSWSLGFHSQGRSRAASRSPRAPYGSRALVGSPGALGPSGPRRAKLRQAPLPHSPGRRSPSNVATGKMRR